MILNLELESSMEIASFIFSFKTSYPNSIVIVLTDHPNSKAEEIVIEFGADEVLNKPLSRKHFALTLRNLNELAYFRMYGSRQLLEYVQSFSGTEHQLNMLDLDGRLKTLKALENDIVRFAVKHNQGNISKTAVDLGIGRSTMYRMAEAVGVWKRKG